MKLAHLGRLLLAPLLATGAVGVHYWLNVPKGPIRVNPRDQGAKKKRKPARTDRAAMTHTPRNAKKLDALWKQHKGTDIEEEPVASTWARSHKGLVNKAVVVARQAAFEGAPEAPQVILTKTRCHTIRCRFLLRGPFSHEVEMLNDAVARLEVENESLWRSHEAVQIEAPDDGSPEDEFYLQVTVAFAADDTDAQDIVMPEDKSATSEGGGNSGLPPFDDEPEATGR